MKMQNEGIKSLLKKQFIALLSSKNTLEEVYRQ